MTSVHRRGQGPWPTSNVDSVVSPWLHSRLDRVEESERSGMARWLLDHVSGETRGTRIVQDMRWTESQLDRLAVFAERLNEGEPIQHVLGEAWFDGLCLKVNGDVLIPRPETEELVAAMATKALEMQKRSHAGAGPFRVVDWCTGSGCVALALKKRLPSSEVLGLEWSASALDMAAGNAASTGLEVVFESADLLNATPPTEPFHLVVSNPPYIPESERDTLHARVTDHEPEMALFVPDDNPLVFYRALEAWCASGGLRQGGWLGMECHTEKAAEVADMLVASGGWKHVEILRDLQGMDRHVVACLGLP